MSSQSTATLDCEKEAPRILTVADRCDGCSAQARVLLVLPSGKDFQLCLHHHNRHADAYPAETHVFEQLGDL